VDLPAHTHIGAALNGLGAGPDLCCAEMRASLLLDLARRRLSAATSRSSCTVSTADLTVSKLAGAARKPTADAAPDAGGTRTCLTPMMRATCAACAGPAPPKAAMAKPRGSRPFSTMCARAAAAMFSQTMV